MSPETLSVSHRHEWQPGPLTAFVVRRRIPLGFLFGGVFLSVLHPTWTSIAMGLPVALLGLAVRTVASGTIRKNADLADLGLYRITRNPLYLGSFLLVTGFSVMSGRWESAFIFPTAFLLVYYQIIFKEEVKLAGLFGEGYAHYCEQTPRLLPRSLPVLQLIQDLRSGFRWALVVKHGEYNAWIAAVILTAAMAVMAATGWRWD